MYLTGKYKSSQSPESMPSTPARLCFERVAKSLKASSGEHSLPSYIDRLGCPCVEKESELISATEYDGGNTCTLKIIL